MARGVVRVLSETGMMATMASGRGLQAAANDRPCPGVRALGFSVMVHVVFCKSAKKYMWNNDRLYGKMTDYSLYDLLYLPSGNMTSFMTVVYFLCCNDRQHPTNSKT